MPSTSEFRKTVSREERKLAMEKMRLKYPDRISIIVEKSKTSQDFEIEKIKYLVPENMTVEQFIQTLLDKNKNKNCRKIPQTEEDKEPTLYLYINNVILDPKTSLKFLYEKNAHTDGFLYIKYSDRYDYGKKTSTLLNTINPWGTTVAENVAKSNSSVEVKVNKLAEDEVLTNSK